ncbi:MAG: hypothetical protein JNK57_04865 [Planctomycetaceae bacterium]|nr:hypothetical protein [Planctomycetaceae bacterium]
MPPFRNLWATLRCMIGCLIIVAGCNSNLDKPVNISETEDRWPNQITVVSFPLYDALRAVGGDKLELYYPELAPGKVMDRESVKRVQASRLIFMDGTHHVGWVDTVSLPESRKRISTFDIMDQLIMVDNLGSHSHGPGGEHSHKGIVAQTWLDPILFQRQLRTVLLACVKSELLSVAEVEQAMQRWQETVRPLEDTLTKLAELPVRNVIADRAGTEYLFRRLDWPVEIQELNRAARLDPGQLERELRQRFEQFPELVIVLTSPPAPELAGLLDQLKIPVVSLDLIDAADGGSYLDRLSQNLKNLQNVVGQGT